LRIIHHNKELKADYTEPLNDLGIESNDVLYTKLRIKGGGRPKFEKNYEEIADLFKENDQGFQDAQKKINPSSIYLL